MDGFEWQCPSCTLLNKAVSFKCMICGTPKGTSTRQTKHHSAAIEKQQVAESLTKLQTPKHISKQGTTTITQSTTPVTTHSTSSNSSAQITTNIGNTVTTDSLGYTSTNINTSIISTGSAVNKRKRTRFKDERKSLHRKFPTLSNIDRTTGRSYTITVDSLTVVITEYDFLYPPSD